MTTSQSLTDHFKDIALIHNNARVGSQVACALSQQAREKNQNHSGKKQSSKTEANVVCRHKHFPKPASVWLLIMTLLCLCLQVVVGGINVDFIAKAKTKTHVISNALYMQSPHTISYPTHSAQHLYRETLFSLFQFGQTNQGSVSQSFGGVGRNVAGEFSFWFCDAMMRSDLMVSLLIFFFFGLFL